MTAPRYLAALALTGLLALVVLPDVLGGLDRWNPFAQFVAFRPWALVGTAALTVLLALLARRRRAAWPCAAGALVVAAVAAALVLPRAIPTGAVPGGHPLTIMTANVYEGRADPAALAALVRDDRPDVVALPEAGDRFRSLIEPLVAPLGYRAYTSAPGAADVGSVAALVSDRLGDVTVQVGRGTSLDPYLTVTGGTLGALQVVAFHAAAPVPALITRWQADLALLARWCAGPGPAVVAGDFNATLDHSPFRTGTAGCGDAAAQAGAGLEPTWGPYGHPGWLRFGPQIDHVLATAGITASAVTVQDLPGSDHRAVLATLVPS